jgi:hypothetical protein
MEFSEKYAPLIIVCFYCALGLFIALLLAGVGTFLYGGSYFARIEAPIFMTIYGFLVGIIFCEVRSYINSKLTGSLLFGILSSQLFFIALFASSLFYGEAPKKPPLDLYLVVSLFFTSTLAVLYFKLVDK